VLFPKSGRLPPDNLIVRMLVYDPSLVCMGVQSLHLRRCQVGGYGQRSGSGDAASHSSNPICGKDVVQVLTGSAINLDQRDKGLQPPKYSFKRDHSLVPRDSDM